MTPASSVWGSVLIYFHSLSLETWQRRDKNDTITLVRTSSIYFIHKTKPMTRQSVFSFFFFFILLFSFYNSLLFKDIRLFRHIPVLICSSNTVKNLFLRNKIQSFSLTGIVWLWLYRMRSSSGSSLCSFGERRASTSCYKIEKQNTPSTCVGQRWAYFWSSTVWPSLD